MVANPHSVVGRRMSFADMEAIGHRYRTAVHECGHGVCARLLALPDCGQVTIIEPNPHAILPIGHGARSICALMGGAVAEALAFGSYYDREHTGLDWQYAAE